MEKYNIKSISGQSLVEIIIAITVGAILIGAASAAIVPILRSNLETRNVQTASSLAQEYLDNVQNLAESNWLNIYIPPGSKGPSSQFYLSATSTTYEILSGATSTVVEGRTFTRYFSIENVNRTSCGVGNATTTATTTPTCNMEPGDSYIAEDPSTQKITATVTWPEGRTISRSQYLTRSRNKVFVQTDWSGGPDQEGPITSENNKFFTSSVIDYTSSVGSITIQGSAASGTLTSSIFDTQVTNGVAVNTIMWQGNQPSGTSVKFQIASTSTIPATWTYRGPNGLETDYYTPAVGLPVQINLQYHNNHRYFRYKISLYSNGSQTPKVDDVIINWSP